MAAPFIPSHGGFIPAGNAGGGGGGATSTGAFGTIYAGTSSDTGPVLSFANANNVSFGMSGSTITASVVPDAGIGLAVAGSTVATGTVLFSNGSGVSFGLNGSTLTASVAAGATATGNFGGIGVNGAGPITAGTAILSDGNNVTFGLNGSTITASASYSQSTAPAAVQVNGSTLTNGTLVITNGNNVSFGLNGSTLTASASYSQSTSPSAIAVVGSTLTNGTAVFSDSNGMSFGMNGSTITGTFAAIKSLQVNGSTVTNGAVVITNGNNVSFGFNGSTITASASYSQSTAPGALAAGTQTATSGTIAFLNGSGVTFGMNGSTAITASVAAGATATGNLGAIAAGTQTATSGTVALVNSNGLTFGMNGSTAITGSYSQSTAPAAIQVNGSTLTNGTLVITNSNNVTFGLNGSTLTASASFAGGGDIRVSAWDNGALPYATTTNGGGANPGYAQFQGATATTQFLYLQRVLINNSLSATRFDFIGAADPAVAITATCVVALYTMGGSTANSVSSFSATRSIQSRQWAALSLPIGTWNVTPGEYLLGIGMSCSNNGLVVAAVGQPMINLASNGSATTNFTRDYFADGGITASAPASIVISQMTASRFLNARPFVRFIGTF